MSLKLNTEVIKRTARETGISEDLLTKVETVVIEETIKAFKNRKDVMWKHFGTFKYRKDREDRLNKEGIGPDRFKDQQQDNIEETKDDTISSNSGG